jgi:hypothetical protein
MMRLNDAADFNPVAIWIDYNALVVAVAGTSRAIDDLNSVFAKTLREFIDNTLRGYRDCEMGQPKPLNPRSQFHQRQRRRRHRFETRAVGETQKA